MQASAKTIARRQIERQIIEDGTAIWKTKKHLDSLFAAEDKKQQWVMLTTYNPWGKPGYGAPMPGALRKTKWIQDEPKEVCANSSVALGRPGHGAPLRTASGKTKTYIKSDPLIMFQFHDSARRTVENDLRYKATRSDKENYRRELDAIICQKKKEKGTEEAVPGAPCEREGWTNDLVFNKMTRDDHLEREQIYEITGGGVELVPLLAKHRMATRCPLPTTDVTRMSRICKCPTKSNRFCPDTPTEREITQDKTQAGMNPIFLLPLPNLRNSKIYIIGDLPKMGTNGPEYFRQLCHQVDERERQKMKEQKEDLMESKKHFETWKGLWGRPGHGAPRALSQREKLEFLLYRIPTRRITSSCTAKSP